MKKIAMVGFFGWGNFGDELFIKAHQQNLGDKFELFVANDLTKAPYYSRPVEEVVGSADAVLIGGGDLINPMRVSELYWNPAYLAKPTYVYGIGVPNQPFRRETVLARYESFLAHKNCKLVVARDRESYEWLKTNFDLGEKLKWYPDPVCSIDLPPATPPTEKTLGVVMREHRSISEEMDPLFTMMDRARSMGYKLKHLVLATDELGEADYGRAMAIRGDHTDEEIIRSEDLDELCQEISNCSMLFSIKFHGMVVATMYGIPSVAMSGTPKNRNFLRMLKTPELQKTYLSEGLEELIPESPQPIDPALIEYLRKGSKEGYRVLKKQLQRDIDPKLPVKIRRKLRWYKVKARRAIRNWKSKRA